MKGQSSLLRGGWTGEGRSEKAGAQLGAALGRSHLCAPTAEEANLATSPGARRLLAVLTATPGERPAGVLWPLQQTTTHLRVQTAIFIFLQLYRSEARNGSPRAEIEGSAGCAGEKRVPRLSRSGVHSWFMAPLHLQSHQCQSSLSHIASL